MFDLSLKFEDVGDLFCWQITNKNNNDYLSIYITHAMTGKAITCGK